MHRKESMFDTYILKLLHTQTHRKEQKTQASTKTSSKSTTAKKSSTTAKTAAKKKTAASSSKKSSGINLGSILNTVNTLKSFQIPDEVKSALKLLGIKFPCKLDELKEQYNSIMSVVHPNKSESTSKSLTSSIISSVAKNSISSSVNSAIKNAISTESSVDDITDAYKTVESFLKKFKG